KPAPGVRVIVVADASSGKMVWKKEIRSFVHPALAARGKRLYYQTKEDLHCIDLESGKEVWQAKRPLELKGHELGWESPTLVVHDDVIFCADFKTICAYSVADGYFLWEAETNSGYNSPPDVFIIDDLVWLKGPQMRGLDLMTGQVRKTLQTTKGYMHPRCYRNKATDRFFLLGNQGVQFVDRNSKEASLHHWLRGTCQYGIMPANGLLYVTPDSCACNMKSKLSGFWAIESDTGRQTMQERLQQNRFVKGPAFGRVNAGRQSAERESETWPVYRHDSSRSGITHSTVGSDLKPAWKADIGGKLSGVTASGGLVFVSSIDEHTVYALDRETGKTAWTYTTGSRVDSPPTIYKGMALFGSADGWVYALRAVDGELVWRFRAAPDEKLTFVNGQLESVWPVHGSLIVQQDKLIVPAGRSSYLDDGIHVYRLDVLSGKMLSDTVMYSPDPKTGKQPADKDTRDMRGLLSDILVAEGDNVYMRHVKLDLESGDHTKTGMHLFSPIGLLDDSWWHRSYWLLNEEFVSHWSGWWKAGNFVPSGRILSYDAKSVFGYGRDKYPAGNTGQFRGGEEYQLFACDRPTVPVTASQLEIHRRRSRRGAPQPKKKENATPLKPTAYRWVNRPSFHVRAMVVAGEMMFAAGPPDVAEKQGAGEKSLLLKNPAETLSAWQGKQGGVMWVLSAKDGKRLAQYKLDAPPVFDGMAATLGRLYMATTDGSVVCLESVKD
ncbi:MAG: PQQ-binding-like beta-propeller repeat protein, partial [Planctomycetes bacterium]|nr:PQQ-binding-like beta-propeller repeat protein [Planctomycetota bacterium]